MTEPDSGPRAGRRPKTLAPLRGSRTAAAVAAVRALHFRRHPPPWIVEDRLAIHFAGKRWRRIIESNPLEWMYSRVVLRGLMPITMQPLVRARFAEDRIVLAAGRRVSQLVLLGSGFETFAFRRPDLPLTVFEADLEATQVLKQERMAAAGIARPPRLRFVPLDFERDSLGERLASSGFDRGKPTFFTWMGVTCYLTAGAIARTLDELAEIAAPGSELAFDYLIAGDRLASEDRVLLRRMQRFVARLGEPMLSAFDPAAVLRELALEEDWELVQHDSPADQTARYLAGRSDLPPLAPLFGCLHLRREPGSPQFRSGCPPKRRGG